MIIFMKRDRLENSGRLMNVILLYGLIVGILDGNLIAMLNFIGYSSRYFNFIIKFVCKVRLIVYRCSLCGFKIYARIITLV